jgi:outer membrane lipoprotein-sorting protein
MNENRNDKLLDKVIRRAVGSETVRFDAAEWTKTHRKEIALIRSRKSTTVPGDTRGRRIWRMIMNTRTLKIAAPTTAVATMVIISIVWAIGGTPSVVFSDVLKQLQTKSYEFVMDVNEGGTGTIIKGTVLEPCKMRLEQTSGMGPIVSIIDNDTHQSLLLWKRFKAAYRFDRQEKEQVGVFGFLLLPGRSVNDLWNLQAGDETKLTQKKVNGLDAQGFRVTQKNDDYTETITVWADAKTAAPLLVDITMQSNQVKGQVLKLSLRDFKVVQNPNPALFSTDVPEGYTLASRKTLKQLMTTSESTSATKEETPNEADNVLKAMDFWRSGKKEKSLITLTEIHWKGRFHFNRERYLFTMTEKQFISLVSADQKKVMAEIMSQSKDCRNIVRELVTLANKARTSGNNAKAETYLQTALGLGELLDRDKNMMLIVRMVGIAIQRHAADELVTLYKDQGRTNPLQAIRKRIITLEKEAKEIRQGR